MTAGHVLHEITISYYCRPYCYHDYCYDYKTLSLIIILVVVLAAVVMVIVLVVLVVVVVIVLPVLLSLFFILMLIICFLVFSRRMRNRICSSPVKTSLNAERKPWLPTFTVVFLSWLPSVSRRRLRRRFPDSLLISPSHRFLPTTCVRTRVCVRASSVVRKGQGSVRPVCVARRLSVAAERERERGRGAPGWCVPQWSPHSVPSLTSRARGDAARPRARRQCYAEGMLEGLRPFWKSA